MDRGLEVFLKGLPSDLTDNSLQAQLTPFITKKLGISDWVCEKPRRKEFGFITFLRRHEGEKFLHIYSEIAVPGLFLKGQKRTRARLQFLGANIYCRESNHAADRVLLRTLVKTADDRTQQEQEGVKVTKDKNVTFELHSLSCGHYEYLNDRFTYTPDIEWPVLGLVKCARDMVIITFGTKRVEILYRTIHEILVGKSPTSLVLTLWEAPRFFDQTVDLAHLMGGMTISTPAAGARAAERFRMSHLPHDSANHEEILGQSLVYRVQVSPLEFDINIQRLKDKDRLSFTNYNLPGFLPGRTFMTDGLRSFKHLVNKCSAASAVPFDVLFQFQALVQNGYLLPQTVETLLKRLCQVTLSISAGAVKKLFSQIPFPGPDEEASTFTPDEIWSYLEENEKEIRQGIAKELISERASQSLVMVYKVQVTPTRITFLGPEPEAKNRILRKFPDHIGYFARVQFCEEDGQDLFFNTKVSLDPIWKRFKSVLMHGIIIAGRKYDFLGFSHSSLRAHGVWFMAPFVDHNKNMRTYFSVINELGTFNKILSPPRCAARIGQAFSETPFSVDLQDLEVDIQRIPDVKSADGTRVFSDGVGTISRSMMEAIHASLPPNRSNTTCFQIRWGGAKGMIALDDTLEGMIMRIRPESMVKFESEDIRHLEICDMGNKPIPLVLNRQMIKILEDMRVADEWFLHVQNLELERLRMITADVHNTIVFLKRQKVADQIKFSQFIKRLHRLGIDYRKDPFLCSVVETVVLREVRLLKHKARIPVEQGVTLFGIMDEFCYLEEDQVYVTFDDGHLPGTRNLDLHGRLVLVTRSPALHPGDIQVRTAVVPPADHPLRSLTNCVVFSQQGKRDLPSQLSGGDLDGDIYNIIWDDFAVNSSKLEFAPADYPRVSPLNIGREVTREDMTNFFVEFMATDQLGVIATKHQILADLKSAGTVDAECQLLAEMHSTGVDYSKSGIPIDTNKLRGLTKTRNRPDFLAPAPPANIVDRTEIVFEAPIAADDDDDESGPRFGYYNSDKILGRLYRAIDEKKIWQKDIRSRVNSSGMSVWDRLLRHIERRCEELGGVNWKPALDEANRIRQTYEDAIWSATMDYADNTSKRLTELEVFTGCIFNKNGVQTRRQRDKSIRLKDDYDRISKWVRDLIRKRGSKTDEDENYDGDEEDDLDQNGGASLGGNGEYESDDKPSGYEYGPTKSPDATVRNVLALELSIACFHAGIAASRAFSGRGDGDFQSFKVIAAQCALSELEAALTEQRTTAGASFMDAAAARHIFMRN
ncbi:hypothetical protein AAE478_005222 [Parahypoxylon ruwenzoriense]